MNTHQIKAMIYRHKNANHTEVHRLVVALSELVYPESLGTWLESPHESFDGLAPLEVIERGEIDRLWNMVFRLRTGMPG